MWTEQYLNAEHAWSPLIATHSTACRGKIEYQLDLDTLGSFKIRHCKLLNKKERIMTTKNLVLVFGLALGSLSASWAQAHAKIEAAEPKPDSELSAAPEKVRLHFNETLEPAFSKIELIDAKNVALKLPKAVVDKADTRTLSVQLPELTAGQYLVRWTTMTRDGHKVKGEYRFKVR